MEERAANGEDDYGKYYQWKEHQYQFFFVINEFWIELEQDF